MDKREERRRKLEKSLSDIRQTATQIENTIQGEKMAKERKFASPKTSEEAELQLPPLEKQLKGKTEREIIENGTLLQKVRLYYILTDYEDYFDNTASSPHEVAEALNRLNTATLSDRDRRNIIQCANEFKALKQHGEQMRFYYKRFQTAFSILARLVNLWDGYEKSAQIYTRLYNLMKEGGSLLTDMATNNYISNILISTGGLWEGAALRFDREKESFFVDVDLKNGRFNEEDIDFLSESHKQRLRKNNMVESLYSKIQKEVANTTETLSDFKAFVVTAEEFMKKSTLRYLPISVKVCLDNAVEERFARYLVQNLSFFRSELNVRRSRGEAITPEEERRAVIPDLYEVEPTPDIADNCSETLAAYWYSRDLIMD